MSPGSKDSGGSKSGLQKKLCCKKNLPDAVLVQTVKNFVVSAAVYIRLRLVTPLIDTGNLVVQNILVSQMCQLLVLADQPG